MPLASSALRAILFAASIPYALTAPLIVTASAEPPRNHLTVGLHHASVGQGSFARYTAGAYSNPRERSLAGIHFGAQRRLGDDFFVLYQAALFSTWAGSATLSYQTAALGWSVDFSESVLGYVGAGVAKHSASRKNVDLRLESDDQPNVGSQTARYSDIGPAVLIGARWQLSDSVQLQPSFRRLRFDHGHMNEVQLDGRLFLKDNFGLTLGFGRREWGNASDSRWRAGVVFRF